MWWAIGIGGIFLYLLVAFTLGLMTLRNGHGSMFFFGIFFPILWIFGAFMSPPGEGGCGVATLVTIPSKPLPIEGVGWGS